MMRKKNIVILGSTGSIGESTLKVVRHLKDRFNIVGIAAGTRWQNVAAQAAEFDCRYACMATDDAYTALRDNLPNSCEALMGEEGMLKMVSDPEVDFVLCGIVGTSGLRPVLTAIEHGKDIGLASKEILVMAGELVMAAAKEKGVKLLPVDSEHNAIFQCLDGRNDQPSRVILTCSGGPFRQTPASEFTSLTPAQALKHPTWDMGRKISIDSATLMNKSLEVIEAKWLFDLKPEQVDVVIHPQSLIHSMVEFNDGSVLAQMSEPDMVFPIQYAMTWPERLPSSLKPMDFTRLREMTFLPPDHERFPTLRMAKEAMQRCGTAPAVFNAVNEVAVPAFLDGSLRFSDIFALIEAVSQQHDVINQPSLEQIVTADSQARQVAAEMIARQKFSL